MAKNGSNAKESSSHNADGKKSASAAEKLKETEQAKKENGEKEAKPTTTTRSRGRKRKKGRAAGGRAKRKAVEDATVEEREDELLDDEANLDDAHGPDTPGGESLSLAGNSEIAETPDVDDLEEAAATPSEGKSAAEEEGEGQETEAGVAAETEPKVDSAARDEEEKGEGEQEEGAPRVEEDGVELKKTPDDNHEQEANGEGINETPNPQGDHELTTAIEDSLGNTTEEEKRASQAPAVDDPIEAGVEAAAAAALPTLNSLDDIDMPDEMEEMAAAAEAAAAAAQKRVGAEAAAEEGDDNTMTFEVIKANALVDDDDDAPAKFTACFQDDNDERIGESRVKDSSSSSSMMNVEGTSSSSNSDSMEEGVESWSKTASEVHAGNGHHLADAGGALPADAAATDAAPREIDRSQEDEFTMDDTIGHSAMVSHMKLAVFSSSGSIIDH